MAVIAAVAGIGHSVSTLAGLLVSESTPLFGFLEVGYRAVVVVAIASEVIATMIRAGFLTAYFRRVARKPAGSLP
ncbi:MAG: hypothetical protein M3071_20440 [Actinomycetota bacterium]|nr:hypothetical protein [Actinomycetota bacterium]